MFKLYVGNLPYTVTQEDLNDLFAEYGTIANINLIKDKFSGRSKGFAFVSFEDKSSADKALQLDGKDYQGRRLKVGEAKDRTGETGGGGSGSKWRSSGNNNRRGAHAGSGNRNHDRYND